MNKYLLAIFAVIISVLAACGGSTPDPTTPAPAPVVVSTNWAGKYTGRIDAPSHEERIRLRNLALEHQGKPVTGNDAVDNAATGGGGVDGGIYIEGAFGFEVDANNQLVKGKGEVVVFGYSFPITGGVINPDGTFSFAAAQLPLSGKIVGTAIEGKATGVAGEEWVYGNIVGVYERGGKL